MSYPQQALQFRSLLTQQGEIQLSLAEVPVPEPGADQVLVRVEAAPINPSDLGLLAMADPNEMVATGNGVHLLTSGQVPANMLRAQAARVGESLPAGNEGAGVVVAAGDTPAAQALLGQTVALFGPPTYSQYRRIKAEQCLVLPAGTTPAQGAACFVNPLTALGMVGTMRLEGHTALVHTAAASNLGQMLQKVCLQDGVALVNIVRKPEQAQLLRGLGAEFVCDSSSDTFQDDLLAALGQTGATLAFDAIGGGRLASQILSAMEVAASKAGGDQGRYGSTVHKQVYVYGGLDRGPTSLNRSFGMAWGIGGWLLTPFLQRVGADESERLRQRVAAEVTTTFASHYTKEVSLAQMLEPAEIAVYGRMATGTKYLVNPNMGL
jgi:NADPH2:quinone reductase